MKKSMVNLIVEYTKEVGENCSWKDVTCSYEFYMKGYLEDLFKAYPTLESQAGHSLIFDETPVLTIFNEDYFYIEDLFCSGLDVVLLMGVFYASCDNWIIQEAIEYFISNSRVNWTWIEAYIEGAVRHSSSLEAPEENQILMLMALVDRWIKDMGDFKIPYLK